MYICVCFIRNQYNTYPIGLLANNATWCQNRGCICISLVRRTYGRIHAVSCIHPVIQTSTIILWTELFPKKRREKIQGEILQRPHSNSNPRVSSEDPRRDSSFQVFPHAIQQLQVILHTELILPQETSKKYYNYKAHPVQIVRRHPPATVPRVSKHSTWQNPAPRPLQHKQASSNSTRQKQHSTRQAASMHSLQTVPRQIPRNPLSIY